MIKRSLAFLIAAVLSAVLITAQINNSKVLDGQIAFFFLPHNITNSQNNTDQQNSTDNNSTDQQNSTSDQQNNTQSQNSTHTILKINTNVSKTNTTNPSTIQSNITNLKKQLFNAQLVVNTTNANIFKIQHQINVLVEQEKVMIAKVYAPILKYDKQKNCSPDQTYGNTDYKTYLTHFSCGHLTVFPNGTSLRQFTIFVNDFHGAGKPIPISLNKTDPVMFRAWMFNGTVPGPTIRVTEGDHVQVKVVNVKESAFSHSLHFHSIHPGSMDGVMGQSGLIFPGMNFTYDFIAAPAGLYPYHCHMAPIQEHISRGLYGEFIIDPKTPRPHAVEMVMLMNAYTYSYAGTNGTGHYRPSLPATMQQIRENLSQVVENSDENNGPDNQFYSVNGMPFGYIGKHMINLQTGVPYRIYLLNMAEFDPVNSFHIHGTMANFTESGTLSSPKVNTDIVTLGQADRGILEFHYDYPGEFMFHSHIAHFADLGWTGFFNVTKSQ